MTAENDGPKSWLKTENFENPKNLPKIRPCVAIVTTSALQRWGCEALVSNEQFKQVKTRFCMRNRQWEPKSVKICQDLTAASVIQYVWRHHFGVNNDYRNAMTITDVKTQIREILQNPKNSRPKSVGTSLLKTSPRRSKAPTGCQ